MRKPVEQLRGSALVEFVLMASFILVPLVIGLVTVGIALNRSLQVAHITRDVARMFVRGVDFSEQANQELIVGSTTRPNLPALAHGLGIQGATGTATGVTEGNGVMVLSVFTRMPSNCNCANANQIVLTRRIVIGNNTLFTSAFGSPPDNLVNADTGAISNYASDPSARANSLSSVVNLTSSEMAYVVESRFTYPDLAIPGVFASPGVYWRAVF